MSCKVNVLWFVICRINFLLWIGYFDRVLYIVYDLNSKIFLVIIFCVIFLIDEINSFVNILLVNKVRMLYILLNYEYGFKFVEWIIL